MNESSLNNPTPVKQLKLTQISKYLSPASSSFNKLDNISAQPQPKRPELAKSKSSKLNSCKLDESVNQGETKYFRKTSKSLKSGDEQPEFKCPICSVDLTSSTDRQTHVNQCLDRGFSSKSVKAPAKATPEASSSAPSSSAVSKIPQLQIEDAVPNCPICGKEFRTLNVPWQILK